MLSESENAFFQALQIVGDGKLHICVKPRMADLFYIQRGTDKSTRATCQNKINMKHIDFVLCRPKSMEPVLAIELDDKSHDKPARIARDEFVDQVFAAAGSKILHIRAKSRYDTDELRQQIQEALDE